MERCNSGTAAEIPATQLRFELECQTTRSPHNRKRSSSSRFVAGNRHRPQACGSVATLYCRGVIHLFRCTATQYPTTFPQNFEFCDSMIRWRHSMTLEKTVFAILILAAVAFAEITWEESRSNRARLELAIASQQQIIDASETRERSRDAALKITLSQISATKKATNTPTQILSALQRSVDLPQPITLQANTENTLGKGIAKSKNAAAFSDSPTTRVPIANSNRNVKVRAQLQSSSPPARVNDSDEAEASPSEFSNSSISNLKDEIRDFFTRKSQSPTNSALSAGNHLSPD